MYYKGNIDVFKNFFSTFHDKFFKLKTKKLKYTDTNFCNKF